MNFFKSKAKTLELLRQSSLQSASILPIHYFSLADWELNPNQCLDGIYILSDNELFIVRSSSLEEDSEAKSNAGAFLSVQNVHKKDLADAINRVFQSYTTKSNADLVLIQPMLRHVHSAGVAFTNDIETSAPYRIISWTVGDGTDGITNGVKGGKTIYSHNSRKMDEPEDIKGISALLDELINYFNYKHLDIEFAVSNLLGVRKLWLLQVRPLITQVDGPQRSEHEVKIKRIENYLTDIMRPNPLLKGKTTALGVMPDWNPAEIIGLRPRPLAKSLYRDLITDSVWAYQRNNYGYRNLRGFPLMVELEGLPYIDTRISFNSFIPQEIEEKLAEKLVDHYLE